jgi:hypothetical protein
MCSILFFAICEPWFRLNIGGVVVGQYYQSVNLATKAGVGNTQFVVVAGKLFYVNCFPIQ